MQVSIYDMDWSHPTAIVVGNENRYASLLLYVFQMQNRVVLCLLASFVLAINHNIVIIHPPKKKHGFLPVILLIFIAFTIDVPYIL